MGNATLHFGQGGLILTDGTQAYMVGANRIEPIDFSFFKELTREDVKGLASVGVSAETRFRPAFVQHSHGLERITEKEHLEETYCCLLSLHWRAYRNLTGEGYKPEDDIAGFVVRSFTEMDDARKLHEEKCGGTVNFVGAEYFLKRDRRKK